MKTKKFIQWLPGIISELIAVIFCIIYALTDGSKFTMYLELTASALLPFLFPIYGLISKKPLPIILSVASSVFVFFACNLGSSLRFYDKIPCWDLIMHGTFGFLCSLVIFVFIMRWNGNKLNPVGCLLIVFVFTLGIAALWEVWEYTVDLITGGDAQNVAQSIASGKSPVSDTMEDIMISMAGSAAFFIMLLADKLNRYKMFTRLCGFSGFEKN